MLGKENGVQAPRPATLTEAPERLTEFAFALGDPDRTALLAALVASEQPATVEGLATIARLETLQAKEHLRILVDTGLATTRRSGLTRKILYVPTVADLELRFFAGKATGAPGKAAKALERDAKRRERQKKKLARKERRIAKEAGKR